MGDRGGADGRPRGHLESPCLSLRSFSAAAPGSGTDRFSSLRLDVLVGHRGLRLAAPPRHRESLRSTGQRLPRTRCLGNTRLSGSPHAVRRLDVPSSVPSRPHVLVHLTRLMALLCFAPHFPPGCAEVQGSDESQSRSWKGRSQDLNPGSWGPAAMPANALPPSAAVRSRDGAPRTPWLATPLRREVT